MAVYEHDESNILITGTDEADSIKSTGSNVTINAGEGKDTVSNSGASVTIDAGYGVDSVNNSGANVSISGGDSGDYIGNTSLGTYSTLNGDAGADTISNAAQYVTISGGVDNDSIKNSGANASIDAGAGADTVSNTGATAYIDGGAGADKITNSGGKSVTIIGGADNDTIFNSGTNVSINAGDGDDSISIGSAGDSVKVDLGNGNDFIRNSGDSVTIIGGEGNDSIHYDGGSYTSVDAGAGDDYIAGKAANNTIFGGAGNDTIYNGRSGSGSYAGGASVLVNGGEGNDYIYNHNAKNVTIYGGTGSDTITNTNSNVTIDGGGGDDVINNSKTQVSIDGGEGNDTISSDGNDSTLAGGKGDDSIKSTGNDVLFKYAPGDGKDTIDGFNESSRLRIGDGTTDTYATLASGNDVIVYVGDGSIVLTGAATLTTINITGKESSNNPFWILNDTTATYGRIGAEPLITVTGVKSLGGISLSGTTVTIAASALAESNVTISDGYTLALASDVAAPQSTAAGWKLNGTTATYYATAGTTAGYSLANNQITYTPAQAGDTFSVMGVKSTSGLSVSGKVVTVSANALNQSAVTVSEGYELALATDVKEPSTIDAGWSIDNNVATYKAAAVNEGYTLDDNKISYTPASGGETLVTVSGVQSTDGLSLSGTTVTVALSALNQGTVTVSGNYTLALGNGVTAPVTSKGSWTLDGTTATYRGDAVTAGYTLENNQITYTPSKDEKVITVSGVKDTKGLTLDDITVTVAASALNNSNVTINSGYTLVMGSDAPTPQTTAESWTISGNVATYKAESTSAGYTFSNNQISYSPATGGESFTVTGVKDTKGLSFNSPNKTVTVSAAALNNKAVTVSDDTYKLALGGDVTAPSTTAAGWTLNGTTATYKAAATSAGYTLEGNQISYTPASGGGTFNVDGVKSLGGISFDGTTVTVSAAALNNSNVTINNNDYKLALATDVTAPSTTEAGWTISGTMATYKKVATNAGYTLANNQITYTPASGGDTVAVNGVKSTEGLSIDGNVVTVATSSLNNTRVTVSDGYTLALANDVIRSARTSAGWTYDKDKATATYSHEATSAGYSIVNNQIVYSEATGGGEISVIGLKSSDGLTLNNKTVTVGNAALNQTAVTISDGYILTLGNDVEKSTNTKESWTISGDVATYTGAATSAGYTLADNKIGYATASGGETFTVTGVKDTKGLSLDGKIVTVANSALNQAEVTISDGYELKLGGDVAESKKQTGWTKLDNGNMSYQTDSTTAGYKLENNQISYVAEILGETLAEISGIDSASTPTLDENGITFAASNFEDNVAVIQSKISNFNMAAGDYADKEFSGTDKIDKITNVGSNLIINGGAGSDKISNRGTGVTIEGGAGDDNVTVSGGDEGGNTFVYADGDGKDILYNFKANDTIQVLGTTTVDADIKNKDVIFKVGKGTITVRDGATSEMAITLIDSAGKAIVEDTYTTEGIISGNKIELAESLKKPYTQAANITEVNGSKVKGGIQITGSGERGKISGGAGNDTLISSEGDFELTGSAGNDLFIFGGGDDTITDYSQGGTNGADRISLGSFAENDYEFDGNDIVLNLENNNTLTIRDGKGKEITFAGKKSTIKSYTDEGIFADKKKSLTLAAGTEESFSAAKNSKLVTIDGSKVEGELEILGNKKANYIVAGKSNTTLNGGKGKDTLVGGEGEDVFIYDNKSGNKTIQNYNYDDGDVITLGDKAEISQVTSKKGGVVLKVGSNTITIENTEKFTFTQGEETKTYDNKMLVSDKSATLASDYKEKVFDLNAEGNDIYNHVSAELSKKAIEIIGDAENNSLTGGKGRDILRGGDNDDTLDGGKGNDTLWGGSDDADTFVYRAGEGTDTIMDYNFDDGDLLQILDKKGNEISNPIKKYSFDGDDLVLSIKGGGKVILANLGTADTKTIKYNNTEQSF